MPVAASRAAAVALVATEHADKRPPYCQHVNVRLRHGVSGPYNDSKTVFPNKATAALR